MVNVKPEEPSVSFDLTALKTAHKHLQQASMTLQTQPILGPLMAVMVNTISAEAVLGKVIAQLSGSLVVPHGTIKS